MAISCLLQHRACAGLALLVLAAPLLRAGAAEPSRPLEETGQSVGSVANASDHSLQTNRANGEQPSGVELDLPSVSSEWPLLGRAVVLMPVLGLMWFCGVAYYRFFSGGTKGKRKVPLAEAAGAESTIKVFLDIQVGDAKPGRVELLLFAEHYPRTAENFRALCTGELGKRSGYRLHYKGSRFHRIIPGFMCQGGNCTGSQSIYGGRFADEWASGYVEHSKAGLLSMANAGRDTNTAQFFITCRACHHLDGRHVVFGQVVEGMDVVRRMEQAGMTKPSIIIDCGEIGSKAAQRRDVNEV